MALKPRRGRPPKVRRLGVLYALPIKGRSYVFLQLASGRLRSIMRPAKENPYDRAHARRRVAAHIKETEE